MNSPKSWPTKARKDAWWPFGRLAKPYRPQQPKPADKVADLPPAPF